MLCSNIFKRLRRKQTISVWYFSTQYDESASKTFAYYVYDSSSPFHWYCKPTEDHAISYVLHMNNKISKSVLDIACGPGTYCERVKQLGFRNVVGIDLSSAQIEEAVRLNKNKDIEYKVVDALELKNEQYANEFHNRFDVVNASWLFDYVESKDKLKTEMEGIYNCLKNGGLYTGMFINENVKSSKQCEWDEFRLYWAKNKQPGADIKEAECVDFYGGDLSLNIYKWYYKTTKELLEQVGFIDIKFIEPTEWDLLNKDVYQWNTDQDRQKFLRYVYEMGNFAQCAMNATKPM